MQGLWMAPTTPSHSQRLTVGPVWGTEEPGERKGLDTELGARREANAVDTVGMSTPRVLPQ